MVLYSDFAALTSSTSADTASAAGTITYNGVGGKVLGFWASGGDQTDTAAQGKKPYFQLTGDGMPGVTPNLPLGRWQSADLIGASTGSRSADATFFPMKANAPAAGKITVTVKNAASTGAELYNFGVIYGAGNLPDWAMLGADPWILTAVPATCITATPTSVTATTEASVGVLTIPASNPSVVALGTFGVTNGVRVTAEEFFGTARYSATGALGGQFEPSQKWPFFGQQDAPAGTDIQDESFSPAASWHPVAYKAAANSTVTSFVTLTTAMSNATSFQAFAALV